MAAFQNQQRFANRAPAYIELAGHFQLLNALSRFQVSDDDPLANMLGYLFRKAFRCLKSHKPDAHF
ncbi:hypothetical protein GCM10011362_27970 [Marinobacter halophilus]|nr:hypothetical protein GCM10011362_27970 [Marinobacter halophilus]